MCSWFLQLKWRIKTFKMKSPHNHIQDMREHFLPQIGNLRRHLQNTWPGVKWITSLTPQNKTEHFFFLILPVHTSVFLVYLLFLLLLPLGRELQGRGDCFHVCITCIKHRAYQTLGAQWIINDWLEMRKRKQNKHLPSTCGVPDAELGALHTCHLTWSSL